jgi:DnaJ family protein A protein 2
LICVFLQPDTVTGDIVFVLQQKEHPKFKRKGDDLFVEHTLSLTEALCGFQFILTHLDGRQLLIKSQPGEVVKPGKLISIMLLTCLVVYPQVFHLIEN